jgi:hypothetical protein
MAKRKAKRPTKSARSTRKPKPALRSARRPTAKPASRVKAKGRKAVPINRTTRKAAPQPAAKAQSSKAARATKRPRLDRARRTLDETVPTPPSSLNMNRRGSSVRTGRAEVAESLREHHGMSPDITGGDVDVDVEDAYFTGEEAPGGDNPTPDQDIVDDIGKALGVQYDDNEELKASDKVSERDKHRWELDPASAEDYKDRK